MIVTDDKKIVNALLEGYTLRTIMIPDPSIPTNYPMHIESYDLPFVIAKDDKFWGFSGVLHLYHQFGKGPGSPETFCYTNIVKNMFCSWTPAINSVCMMSKTRYKEHNWILRKSGNLIWDSSDKTSDVNLVAEAIKKGSILWIAMQDAEDIWQFHPVDVPMFEVEEKRFILKTENDTYPAFFRSIESVITEYNTNKLYYDTKPASNEAGGVKWLQINAFFSTFYNLFSDGTYYNYFDIARGTKQPYKQLKVFEELDFDEGTEINA